LSQQVFKHVPQPLPSKALRRRNTKHKHAQKLNKKKNGDKHKEEEKTDTKKE